MHTNHMSFPQIYPLQMQFSPLKNKIKRIKLNNFFFFESSSLLTVISSSLKNI